MRRYENVAVVQDTERMREDLDAVFKETVSRTVTKLVVKDVKKKPSMDDQNRTFRTRLVVFWMLTNAGLAVAIENIDGLQSNESEDGQDLRKKQKIYFTFILCSNFGISAVKFVGVSDFILRRSESELAPSSACITISSTIFFLFSESCKMLSWSPFIYCVFTGVCWVGDYKKNCNFKKNVVPCSSINTHLNQFS